MRATPGKHWHARLPFCPQLQQGITMKQPTQRRSDDGWSGIEVSQVCWGQVLQLESALQRLDGLTVLYMSCSHSADVCCAFWFAGGREGPRARNNAVAWPVTFRVPNITCLETRRFPAETLPHITHGKWQMTLTRLLSLYSVGCTVFAADWASRERAPRATGLSRVRHDMQSSDLRSARDCKRQ